MYLKRLVISVDEQPGHTVPFIVIYERDPIQFSNGTSPLVSDLTVVP